MENNKKVYKFEDLEVWKLAHKLTLEIYKITVKFPPGVKYISQEEYDRFAENYDIIGKMLTRLYQSLSKKYQH